MVHVTDICVSSTQRIHCMQMNDLTSLLLSKLTLSIPERTHCNANEVYCYANEVYCYVNELTNSLLLIQPVYCVKSERSRQFIKWWKIKDKRC